MEAFGVKSWKTKCEISDVDLLGFLLTQISKL